MMSGEIQFGNLAAPAPLRANLKGEADLVFLTGGINQQFIMGRPGISDREQLAGKKIGFVGDGGLNDALVKFIIEKLDAAGIDGLARGTAFRPAATAELDSPRSAADATRWSARRRNPSTPRKGCKYLIDFAEYGLNYALGGIAARRDYVEAESRNHAESLSKPMSKACTVIAPTASLRWRSKPNTAASPIAA